MSEGEANEFSYVHINNEYDIHVDKSSWLPKKWDKKVFGIPGSRVDEMTKEKWEEKRITTKTIQYLRKGTIKPGISI